MLAFAKRVHRAADRRCDGRAPPDELGLGEPYNDPAVAYFGLANAVFAIGDTFLEVVSPTQPDASAARHLERRGGDGGYMLMLQVDDLAGARSRAGELGVREVFEVDVDEIAEVHLHPADMRGAIVSLSRPEPPTAGSGADPTGISARRQAQSPAPRSLSPTPMQPRSAGAESSERRRAGQGSSSRTTRPNRGLTVVRPRRATNGREPVEIAGVRFTFD